MRSLAIFAGSLAAASQVLGFASALTPDRVHLAAHKVVRQDKAPTQTPTQVPRPKVITSQGCFASTGNMTLMKLDPSRVSTGECREACMDDYLAFGVMGQKCYCGNEYPEEDALSDDKNCNYPCPSYPFEVCGGIGKPGYMSVFNLGIELTLDNYKPEDKDDDKKDDKKDDEKTEPTSSTAVASQTSTSAPEKTVVESKEPEEDNKDEGPSIAGIVAGSVVGVLAVAGAALGVWFFMRRRRNTEIEEEHRRNAAVNAFISGSKPPGSSGSISMTDSRLEPGLAHRRLSDGSIADNEDYSRKILRVSTPSISVHPAAPIADLSLGHQRVKVVKIPCFLFFRLNTVPHRTLAFLAFLG
jgi:cell wall integrity and stress response component